MSESIRQVVQSKYASVAKSGLSTGHTTIQRERLCGQRSGLCRETSLTAETMAAG